MAEILHVFDEPMVHISDRAELGPRALGNRSIIAPAVNPSMKVRLNQVKNREEYRPVAPICMEEEAAAIFSPGNSDPYMLFDHKVKPEWMDKVPAICHIDGTARLQTISRDSNPRVYELLAAYKELSGVPVLCNTSANYSGKGFFPDVESVIKWDKVNMVWSNGKLYAKRGSEVQLKATIFETQNNLV